MYVERLIGANEQIVLATHPHAMMVAGTIVRSAISFLITLALAIWLPVLVPPLAADTPQAVRTAVQWLPLILAWVAVLAAVSLLFRTIGSYLTWRSREYVVTNSRLLRADGIISKRSTSVPLERINNLLVDQSLTGRIWNYGKITVLSGNDYSADVFVYVPGVLEFQRAVISARDTRAPNYPPSAPTQPNRIITPQDPGNNYR